MPTQVVLGKDRGVGLESVELAMNLEDEFGISVPDELLQRAATVGEFYDAILPLVRETGKTEFRGRPDLDEYLWSRVRVLVTGQCLNLPSEAITRATRFVEDLGYG